MASLTIEHKLPEALLEQDTYDNIRFAWNLDNDLILDMEGDRIIIDAGGIETLIEVLEFLNMRRNMHDSLPNTLEGDA